MDGLLYYLTFTELEMRHGTTNRRQRNRGNGHRNNHQPQRSQVYDSNGPEVRIRGTAYQVAEKYLSLAKDASSAGDRIMAESYYQHAEHYIRIIGEFNGTFDANRMERSVPGESYDDVGNKKETVAVRITEREDLALPASILRPTVTKPENAVREAETVE